MPYLPATRTFLVHTGCERRDITMTPPSRWPLRIHSAACRQLSVVSLGRRTQEEGRRAMGRTILIQGRLTANVSCLHQPGKLSGTSRQGWVAVKCLPQVALGPPSVWAGRLETNRFGREGRKQNQALMKGSRYIKQALRPANAILKKAYLPPAGCWCNVLAET